MLIFQLFLFKMSDDGFRVEDFWFAFLKRLLRFLCVSYLLDQRRLLDKLEQAGFVDFGLFKCENLLLELRLNLLL